MILRGGVVQHQRISTISRISINSRISRFWCQFFCYLCNNVYTLSKFSIELNMSECKKVEVSGCWGCLTLDCQKPLHLWNLGKGGVTDVRTVEKFWHWWKFILWEIEVNDICLRWVLLFMLLASPSRAVEWRHGICLSRTGKIYQVYMWNGTAYIFMAI